MLILTRRAGESIVISDDITVTVLSFKGHQARIGISAPKNIEVHREEVHNRIKLEQKAQEGEQKQRDTMETLFKTNWQLIGW